MDFFTTYIFLAIIAIVANVLFWGGLIYFAVRFWRSKSGLTKAEKTAILTGAMGAMSSGKRNSEPGPAGMSARQSLINGGVDPNG